MYFVVMVYMYINVLFGASSDPLVDFLALASGKPRRPLDLSIITQAERQVLTMACVDHA